MALLHHKVLHVTRLGHAGREICIFFRMLLLLHHAEKRLRGTQRASQLGFRRFTEARGVRLRADCEIVYAARVRGHFPAVRALNSHFNVQLSRAQSHKT